MLKFYNSISRQKEDFIPLDSNNIKMYVCGPTVYDDIHIGNARPLVVFDSIYRLLSMIYPNVVFVRNITDVDDKIIQRAKESNRTIFELTQTTTANFIADTVYLGCLKPTHEPKATDNIDQMQDIIKTLLSKGHAYIVNKEVLFSVDSYKDYGELSKLKQQDIIAGYRVEVDSTKRNPADFILWKPSKEDEIGWDSPWGYGRPGWHIECSAMLRRYLGDNIDIHGGGLDLTFPHHENEIAQSVCSCEVNTTKLAKYWLHNGFLMVEGNKMSKSLGNFITVNSLKNKYSGEEVRLTILSTHYRQPLDFKEDSLKQSKSILNKFYSIIKDSKFEYKKEIYNGDILEALKDDFNTPMALTILHKKMADYVKKPTQELYQEIMSACYILGILQQNIEDIKNSEITEVEITTLISERKQAKDSKNFKKADEIRDYLLSKNIEIKDTKEGTIWSIK